MHTERGLDLGRLADDEKSVEVLERLHVAPPGRGRQTVSDQPGDNLVDIIRARFPRRDRQERQEPFQHTAGILDEHRAESPR